MLEYIMGYDKPIVVAEIGCNHQGDFNTALELINLAKDCGASYAKFQKRHITELLSQKQYNMPHPNSYNAFGVTYGKHREYLEFSLEQHAKLKQHCENLEIGYSVSVWGETSAKEIIQLNPDYIKVPSACNNNLNLLKILRDEYEGEIHISLGMTFENELVDILQLFEEASTLQRLVLYACTSGYPIPFEEVHLLEILKLKGQLMKTINAIGFSGHHLGIAIDVAAYTLGATWIERHFTKDRTWKGTDHAASLEPEGLRKLVRDLDATYRALTYKPAEMSSLEQEQREKLKYKAR
ncbi:N-acetylneuraminate synthase family protein [Pontibacter sp. CAU 1760]